MESITVEDVNNNASASSPSPLAAVEFGNFSIPAPEDISSDSSDIPPQDNGRNSTAEVANNSSGITPADIDDVAVDNEKEVLARGKSGDISVEGNGSDVSQPFQCSEKFVICVLQCQEKWGE